MKKLFTFMLFLCAALTASADDHEWKVVGAAAAVGGWDYAKGVTMEKQDDGTFKATTAGLNSGVKIVRDGGTWFGYTKNPNNGDKARMEDLNIAHNTITLCDGANMWLLKDDINYVLTLNVTDADAPELTIVPADGWKISIKSDFNDWKYLDMEKGDDGIFRYEGLTIAAGKQLAFADNLNPYEWVASENTDSWYELKRGHCYEISIGNGPDQKAFTFSHDGTWTIEFNPTTKKFNAICTSETYGVVGDEPFLGSHWENDIELAATPTNYVYSATVNRDIKAGEYKYKMRTNGIWSRYDLPSDTDNKITIPYDGTYTLTFWANLEKNTFTCDAVPTALSVPVANEVSGTPYLTYGNKDYAVSFEDNDDITVFTAQSDVEDGMIKLTSVDSKKVPAGAAVVLRNFKGFKGTLNISVADNDQVEALTGNALLLSDGTVSGGDKIFCVAKGDKGVGFYPVESTVLIPAGKAYLDLSNSSLAPKFIGFPGETTGIDALENGEATAEKAGAIYTLDGRRVNGNLSHGLYIQNGKKFVVK